MKFKEKMWCLFKVPKDKSDTSFGRSKEQFIGYYLFIEDILVKSRKAWILFSTLCGLGKRGLTCFGNLLPKNMQLLNW